MPRGRPVLAFAAAGLSVLLLVTLLWASLVIAPVVPFSGRPAPAVAPACTGQSPGCGPSNLTCPGQIGVTYVTLCDVRVAYGEYPLLRNGYEGQNETIAVIDAYDDQYPSSIYASDFTNFSIVNGLPYDNVLTTLWYDFNASTNYNLTLRNVGWSLETALDMEWTHAMAPEANILLVLTPGENESLFDAVGYVIDHNLANIISMSWGEAWWNLNASLQASFNASLAASVSHKVTLFAASGDCGANFGLPTPVTFLPADSDYVTGVGGTVLNSTPQGDYVGETAWSGNVVPPTNCSNQGGSGGGFANWSRPAYQDNIGWTNHTGRGVPDVSALSLPAVRIQYWGFNVTVGGTSLSSPVWAGLLATIESYTHKDYGFLNPDLYAIYNNSTAYHLAFHDITTGSNGYAAGTGWDPVTGLGTPNATNLAKVLTPTSAHLNNTTNGTNGTGGGGGSGGGGGGSGGGGGGGSGGGGGGGSGGTNTTNGTGGVTGTSTHATSALSAIETLLVGIGGGVAFLAVGVLLLFFAPGIWKLAGLVFLGAAVFLFWHSGVLGL